MMTRLIEPQEARQTAQQAKIKSFFIFRVCLFVMIISEVLESEDTDKQKARTSSQDAGFCGLPQPCPRTTE
jgi:hypothetical protein